MLCYLSWSVVSLTDYEGDNVDNDDGDKYDDDDNDVSCLCV